MLGCSAGSLVHLSTAPGATMALGWGGVAAVQCSSALGCGLQEAACTAPLLLRRLAEGDLPGEVTLLMAPSAVAAAPWLSWSGQASGGTYLRCVVQTNTKLKWLEAFIGSCAQGTPTTGEFSEFRSSKSMWDLHSRHPHRGNFS